MGPHRLLMTMLLLLLMSLNVDTLSNQYSVKCARHQPTTPTTTDDDDDTAAAAAASLTRSVSLPNMAKIESQK